MYDTTFKCTYNLIEDEEESEILYKMQYLQAFCVDDWDGDKIHKTLDYVSELLKNNEKGRDVMKHMREKLSISWEGDTEILFLFTYHYFYLAHECIIDIITTSDISDERYYKLIEAIKNNQ